MDKISIIILNLILIIFLRSCLSVPPNILLILTDDQDLILNGLDPLTKTQKLLNAKGATILTGFTSSPICCPSRASILTGNYAHNTRTFNNSATGGCFGEFWQKKVEPYALPVMLQNNNYNTFFSGKYLNQYYSSKVPPGWNNWNGLLGNSKYYNYTLNENGVLKKYEDKYLTSVIKNHALQFITSQKPKKPFFAMISVPSAHAPFTPEPQYSEYFPNITALRTKNFNKSPEKNEKHWLMTMPPKTLSQVALDRLDEIYRMRWQTLLSVDDLVQDLVVLLGKMQFIENTYIVFTSDNGYHMGQFGQAYDKRQPYSTDTNIPLVVRGPKIPIKSLNNQPIALIDLMPTFLEWANIPFNESQYDGRSIKKLLEDPDSPIEERQILIEYWGEDSLNDYTPECPWKKNDRLDGCTIDADCKCQDSWNNTYSCIRHLASDTNFMFCEFADGLVEAYDLKVDTSEMENIAYEILPSEHARYSLALGRLNKCSGKTCKTLY